MNLNLLAPYCLRCREFIDPDERGYFETYDAWGIQTREYFVKWSCPHCGATEEEGDIIEAFRCATPDCENKASDEDDLCDSCLAAFNRSEADAEARLAAFLEVAASLARRIT